MAVFGNECEGGLSESVDDSASISVSLEFAMGLKFFRTPVRE